MNFADAGHAGHAEREDTIVTDIGTRGTAYSRRAKNRKLWDRQNGYYSTVFVKPASSRGHRANAERRIQRNSYIQYQSCRGS